MMAFIFITAINFFIPIPISVIASGDDVEKALYSATNEAVKYIMNSLGLEWEDAYILASLSVDLKVSQVVDPKKTIRAAIPKHVVSTEKLIKSLK